MLTNIILKRLYLVGDFSLPLLVHFSLPVTEGQPLADGHRKSVHRKAYSQCEKFEKSHNFPIPLSVSPRRPPTQPKKDSAEGGRTPLSVSLVFSGRTRFPSICWQCRGIPQTTPPQGVLLFYLIMESLSSSSFGNCPCPVPQSDMVGMNRDMDCAKY